MKQLLLLAALINSIVLLGTNKIDSLKNLIDENPVENLNTYLEIATLYSMSEFDSALFYCDIIVNTASTKNLEVTKAKALKIIGNVNFRQGNFDDALSYYLKSLDIFKFKNETTEMAKINNNIGLLYQYWGKNTKAIQYLKKTLLYYEESKNELLKTGPLINIGLIHFRTGDYKNAAQFFIEANVIAKQHNESQIIINSLHNLAAVYNEWGKYNLAIESYNEVIEESKNINDKYAIATALNNIGIVFEELGHNATAIEYFLNSLELNKEIKAKAQIPKSLMKIADVYSDWGKYEIALDYYYQALEQTEILNDKFTRANVLSGIATVYTNTNLYKKALDYFGEAEKIFEALNSKKEIAELYANIGSIYSEFLGNYKKAETNFKISQKLLNEIDVKEPLANLHLQMAQNYFKQNKYSEAIANCQQSINFNNHNYYHLYESYYILHKSYKSNGNLNNSIEAIETAMLYKDSISLQEYSEQLAKYEFNYELQKKEQEIELLTQKTNISELEINRKKNARNMFIGFSIMLVLMLFISIFILLKYKTLNSKLLQQQNEIQGQKLKLEEANEKLLTAKNNAEKLSKFKNQFLANISHEIRTPLNAILGYAKLINKNLVKETNRNHINHVIQSSENLLVIINDLLDFSRIEAGKMVIESKEFKPFDIITQTISTLKFKSEEKNIKLEIHFDPLVPKYVIGDPYRLSQILINLINNAIKFSPEGQVVGVETTGEIHKDKCLLTFIVRDNGIGIQESKLETIFESFTQAHSDTARDNIGTGLGLAIVKRLIELQNGEISVKSKVGKGTEFTLSIPYLINQTVDQTDLGKNKQSNIEINQQKDYCILLVEDNEINQELAKDTILSWEQKFIVDIAENGKEALEKMQNKNYDVILMDIQMPVMDGHEATQYIRTSLPKPICNTPIIGMTAHAMTSEKEQAINNGMNEYIIKPFNPDELKQKILFFVNSIE